MVRDLQYEQLNTIYDEDYRRNGIKCKNYVLCQHILPPDHYENFAGFHRMIHSQVEPVTASPFSKASLELCIGPIIVSLLRNAENVSGVPISNNWIDKLGLRFNTCT